MAFTVKVEPTLTGGTDVNLLANGVTASKGAYVFPGGSRLERTSVDVTVGQKGTKAAPLASTGLRVVDTVVTESETCCSVAADQITHDYGVRYPLMSGITAAVAEASLDRYLAVVNSAAFRAAYLNGILPAA